jgi:hypothetical protein
MSDYRAPPRATGWLQRPFGRLHDKITGKGPALVFAHGLGGNHPSCSEVETVASSGHSPYFEQAPEINELVDAFLARHS